MLFQLSLRSEEYTQSQHRPSLSQFLAYVERSLSRVRERTRKLYSLIDVADEELFYLFLERGYEIEGCLRRPYSVARDSLVLAKLL